MDSERPVRALPRGLAFSDPEKQVYLVRRPPDQVRLWLRFDSHVDCHDSDIATLRAWGRQQAPALAEWIERALSVTPPRHFAGLSLDRPLLMGIVNVTPDSFSDGGRFFDPAAAIAHGHALAAAGADIIDIGGESTRPGAEPVAVEEEIARISPVVAALAQDGLTVSIDSRHAAVMKAALSLGAGIINDVTALSHDPESMEVAAASSAAVILMHSQGEPRDMQHNPRYRHALLDIHDWLGERLRRCLAAGIGKERLCIDPGIGFGKTLAHNLEILCDLDLYHGLGVALLLGVSRKSFIASLSRGEAPDWRLAGSLAAALAGLRRGAQILRVHDVAETAQAVAVWRAIEQSEMRRVSLGAL